MTNSRTLSTFEAINLGLICSAARQGSRVARLLRDGNAAGQLVTGTARCVGDDRGNYLGAGEDVRDAYLRVTTTAGWEVFWPLSELSKELGDYFIAPYEP